MIPKIISAFKYIDVRNILKLSVGIIVSQVVGILGQIIAARQFSPQMFGELAVIVSLTATMLPIITLQYERCIVTVSTNEESNAITKLSIIITIILSLFFGIGIWIYSGITQDPFRDVGNFVYLVVPMLMISALLNIADQYSTRYQNFKLISVSMIVKSSISNTVKIILGIFYRATVSLYISNFTSLIAGLIIQTKTVRKNIKEIAAIPNKTLIAIAKKNIRQPLFSLPGLFFSNFSSAVLPTYIAALYTTEEAGYYSFATSLISIAIVLISGSLSSVYLQKASTEYTETGMFKQSSKSIFVILLFVTIPVYLFLFIFAEKLFGLLFGSEWIISGRYVRYMIPMFVSQTFTSVMMPSLIICNKQLQKMILQSLLLIGSISVFIFATSMRIGIESYLIWHCGVQSGIQILLIVYIFMVSRNDHNIDISCK